MAQARRPRAATEEKRKRILDATEEIMLKDGYAAVSSRSVATAVGHPGAPRALLLPDARRPLRRRAPAPRGAQRRADGRGARVAGAAAGLVGAGVGPAGHRAVRRAAGGGEPPAGAQGRGRRDRPRGPAHADGALETLLDEYGIDPRLFPPPLVAAAIQGLAFSVVQDQVAGYDTAADEAIAAMDRLVDRLEAGRAGPVDGRASRKLERSFKVSSGESMATTRPIRFGFTGGASSKRAEAARLGPRGRGARLLDLRPGRPLRPPVRAA